MSRRSFFEGLPRNGDVAALAHLCWGQSLALTPTIAISFALEGEKKGEKVTGHNAAKHGDLAPGAAELPS